MNYYRVLANAPEERVCALAEQVLAGSPQVRLLSGPRTGLIMLRVQETVANSQFYAGEVLVTEVRLELDGQFGFGMVMGDHAQHAMAMALLDAAIRKEDTFSEQVRTELATLDEALTRERLDLQRLVASTNVHFERM